MKTIICGSRGLTDNQYFTDCMYSYALNITDILSGMASGPDTQALAWAKKNKINTIEYPADWSRHGKKAGILRNIEMAGDAEACIAFWDGKSKGTLQMFRYAADKGLYVKVFLYE